MAERRIKMFKDRITIHTDTTGGREDPYHPLIEIDTKLADGQKVKLVLKTNPNGEPSSVVEVKNN